MKMPEIRLIDAVALHKRIEKNLLASNPFTIEKQCYEDALNSIDEAPAIDPESLRCMTKFVPVAPESDVEWTCIKCGGVISTDWDGIDDFAFCPYCGAKMEGVE